MSIPQTDKKRYHYSPADSPRGVRLVCHQCRQEFFDWPHRAFRKYCSRICANASKCIPAETTYFEKVVKSVDPDACWGWNGNKTIHGYGQMTKKRGNYAAHRVAYEIFIGPIPEGLNVLHHCDNPPCTNPKHLFLGTHKDNSADMVTKGRGGKPPRLIGERNHKSKLTEQDVRELRKRWAGGERYKVLAHDYGISMSVVWTVIAHKTWKHID